MAGSARKQNSEARSAVKAFRRRVILAVLIFIGQRKLKWSPVIFIAISAVVGIVFKF